MGKEVIIKNDSNDHLYFTQVPNIIIDFLPADEKLLYVAIRRRAGETKTCYVSFNNLAKSIGVHKTKIPKLIEELKKKKVIAEIDKKKVNGGLVRQFVVLDIWFLNMQYYESIKGGSNSTTSPFGGSDSTAGGSNSTTMVVPNPTQRITPLKKITKENDEAFERMQKAKQALVDFKKM